jgi:hypothetical protein
VKQGKDWKILKRKKENVQDIVKEKNKINMEKKP